MSEARRRTNPTRDHNSRCRLVVEAAAERFPATIADGPSTPDYYDLVLTESDHEPVGIASPIKARAAADRLPNNPHRRGRWNFRRQTHDRLLAVDGYYALGVYTETDEVIGVELVPAEDVAEITDGRWRETETTEMVQVSWSRILNDLEEPNRGDGE